MKARNKYLEKAVKMLLTQDGDEVGDAEEGDDDQQRLRRLPVLVVRLAPPCGG
jgi:hypothetical protein